MPNLNMDGALSFVDIAANILAPGSRERTMIDLAKQRNDIWEDLVVRPASDGSVEEVEILTSLPKATWLHIGKGLVSSKGGQAKVRMVAGNVGSKLEIFDKDKRKAEATGAWNRMYKLRTKGHVDAIALAVIKKMLYGNLKDEPDGFNGLTNWYGAHSSNDDRLPAYNVVDAGGKDGKSLGSIFLVGMGDEGVYGFYPHESKTAGIEISPLEKVRLTEEGNPKATLWGWEQDYEMYLGLAVADWRKAGRLCNIDRYMRKHVTGSTAAERRANKIEMAETFLTHLDSVISRVDPDGVRRYMYMDQEIWDQLCEFVTAVTRTNAITEKDVEGKTVQSYRGIPVRINKVQNVDEPEVGAAV